MKAPLRIKGLALPCPRIPSLWLRPLLLLLFLLVLAFIRAAAQPALQTDLPDYPPGSTVTLTGTGFQPGEPVELQVVHYAPDSLGTDPEDHQPWTVVADDSGGFITTWLVPIDGDEAWATLLAKADGLTSGLHAEVIFTDAGNCDLGVMTFASGADKRCQGGGSSTFSVVHSNGSTVTWTIVNADNNAPAIAIATLSASDVGGGSSATSTVTVTWDAGFSGTARIRATANNCNGLSQRTQDVVVTAPPAASNASVNSAVAANVSSGYIIVSWSGVTGATKYLLDVSTSSDFSSFITAGVITYQNYNLGDPPANQRSFKIDNLTAGTVYYIRVWAVNSCANAASAPGFRQPTRPPAPTANPIVAGNCAQMTVSWSAVAGVNGYYIDVTRNNSSFNANFVGDFNNKPVGNVTSFNVTGLAPGNTYFFRVRSEKNETSSESSATASYIVPSLTTDPGTIIGNAAVCPGANGISYSVPGVSAVTYTWILPTGASIASGTGTNAITVNFGSSAGTITVRGSNACGVSSKVISLNVAPAVTVDPSPQSITYGSNASFTVTATGTPAPTYRWQEYTGSWNDLAEDNNYHGAGAASLGIDTPGVAASGRKYRCIVGNSCGTDMSDDAALTVAPRPITLTAVRKTKVYGDSDPALTAEVTSGSIVAPDVPTGLLTRASGTNVGRYLISKGTYTYGSNYTETYVEDSLFITPRPVTITANAAGKVYGDPDTLLKAQVTAGNIVFNDAFTGLLVRAEGEDKGTYAISKGSYTYGSNYDETFTGALFTISRRPLQINVTAGQHKTYGDSDPAGFAFTIGDGQSLASWDAFSGALTRDPGDAAGTYTILQAGLAIKNGADDNTTNYSISYNGSTFAIDKRAITITADAKSKIYGAADPELTARVTSGSIVSPDAATGALLRAEGEHAGRYAIAQGTYTYGANYAETFVGDSLTINRRPITITADAVYKTYGNSDPDLTAQVTSGNIVGSDVASGMLIRTGGEDVGRYAIERGTYSYGSDYDETYVRDSLTINPRALTINVSPGQHKIYGDADPTPFGFSIGVGQSLASWDAFSGGLTRVAGTTAGNYDILLAGLAIMDGSDDNTANYNIIYNGGSFAIDKRPITLTADPKSKVYGATDPPLTAQVTAGTIAGTDVAGGTLSRTAGENVGKYAITQGTYTYGSNYAETFTGDSLTISRRPVTVTANPKSKVYGASDPALTYMITDGSLAFSDTFSGSLARDPGEDVNTYAIRQGTLALSSNYTLLYGGALFTINAAAITNSVRVLGPSSRQYSDTTTFKAVIAGGAPLIVNAPGAASSVTFKVGTQEMGTIPFTIVGPDLVACLPASLLETVLNQMAPGIKTICAVLNGPNANYGLNASNNKVSNSSFSITQEDARIEYTGDQIMSTGTGTSATVRLRATILDISAVPGDAAYDPAAGDIRKAKVRFVNGETRVPLSGWLPVTLVAGDTRVGLVTYDTVITLGSTETDRELNFGIEVNNGYYVRNSSADNTVVTVYKPVGDFITGGGHIVPDKSVGTFKSDVNTKTNFGFNVKYNKKGTSLQGNMNIIFRRTESDGVLHTYQIKANAMQTLAVNATNPLQQTAQFTSKANLTDVTNPLAPVTKTGNKTLYVYMTDRGDPGTLDSISFVLVETGSNTGVLANILYSSEWVSNKNSQKGLRGGNLVVKSGFNLSTTSPLTSGRSSTGDLSTTSESLARNEAPAARFGIRAYPNSSPDQFRLVVESDDARSPIQLRIFDFSGRLVQQFTALAAGQLLQVGSGYARGTYVAEAIQGGRRSTVKLIKE